MAGETTTIARPYAEAVFKSAKESGQVEAWSEALGLLAELTRDPTLVALIGNPNVSKERLRDLIIEVAGQALSAEATNLVRLMADNGRLAAIPEMASLFEASREADQGRRKVMVRSAFPLDEAQSSDIAQAMARRLGGQVDLTVEVDPSLIGGIEVRAGDLVVDDSVRGKLQQLAQALQF